MHRYKVTFSNGNTCIIPADGFQDANSKAVKWFEEIGMPQSGLSTVELIA